MGMHNWRSRVYQIPMLLRRNPNVAITPSTQVPQFLYFGMLVLHIIFDWQACRIVDSDIAAQPKEETGRLKSGQA